MPVRKWPTSGKGQGLSSAEIDRLLARRSLASLATFDARGRIHVVPMWFQADDGVLLFPTSSRSRKVKNISRAPKATAMVQRARGGPSVRGVMAIGHIEVITGDEARRLNRRIHYRYVTEVGMRQPDVIELLRNDDVTLRLLVEEVVTWKSNP